MRIMYSVCIVCVQTSPVTFNAWMKIEATVHAYQRYDIILYIPVIYLVSYSVTKLKSILILLLNRSIIIIWNPVYSVLCAWVSVKNIHRCLELKSKMLTSSGESRHAKKFDLSSVHSDDKIAIQTLVIKIYRHQDHRKIVAIEGGRLSPRQLNLIVVILRIGELRDAECTVKQPIIE